MKNLYYLLIFFFCSTLLYAQSKEIKGVVVDIESEPIIGASVVEMGTSNGTVTNFDGEFKLIVQSENAKISVSYLGYNTQVISIDNKSDFKIILQEDTQTLDEVVITGYGTSQKRSLMTNSISKLDNKTLETSVMANVASSLQGTVSGLRVVNTSGSPGSAPNIVLRGGASISNPNAGPLVVVDGIIRTLNDINPSDIESIEVMKDAASTAIYGSRANNGVILVTTKKGKEGHSEISYKFRGGWNYARKGYKFLGAEDYLYYNRLGYKRTGMPGIENVNGYGTNTTGIFSIAKLTDDNKHLLQQGWQSMKDPYDESQTLIFQDFAGQLHDDAFNDTAFMEDHHISFSGGNDKSSFISSFGYFKENGQVVSTKYERINGSINGLYKIKPYLTINGGGSFSIAKTPGMWIPEANLFYRSMSLWPTWNPYDENGEPNSGLGEADGNPLYWISKYYRKNKTRRTQFNVGPQITIIPKKLIVNGNASIYYTDYNFQSFNKKFKLQNRPTPDTNRAGGFITEETIQQQYNATVTYQETFAEKHNLDAMIVEKYL